MPRTASRKKADEAQAMTPQQIMREVNKKWGAGTMTLASDPTLRITRLPSGILSMDIALGGGIARGRHTEVYGSYGVGKTYYTYRAIANTQAAGGLCAFIDAEGSFDPDFAAACGVDLEALAFHRQTHGNRVVNFMETLTRSGIYDMIVLDSIAALLPKSEQESDMEESSYGTAQAKLMSAALRRLTAANNTTALVYINQTREAIGVVFGSKSITSGGKAMGFYAGTRIEMVRTENIKRKARHIDPSKGDETEKDVVKGHRVLVRIQKDKTGGAVQHSETSFVFDYDLGGIDPIEDLIYLGRRYGLVHKSGQKAATKWWVVEYEEEAQTGKVRFHRWLSRNAAVAEELRENILEAASADSTDDDDEAEEEG